jgi:hypothetical protein
MYDLDHQYRIHQKGHRDVVIEVMHLEHITTVTLSKRQFLDIKYHTQESI